MKIVPQSVTLLDTMGSDLSVVNAARVSFHKVSHELTEQDKKLITYLASNGHWTPFAHCFLSFRIKAPIFVARQLVKHQVGLAWNEVSRRYVSDAPEFFWPDKWRGKPINAKQGSDGIVDWKLDPRTIHIALQTYNSALEHGVAPEQARIVLPLNTMTEWIWSGSLMAFARVCKLRLDPHSQQETRDIADKISNHIPAEFYYSWQALRNL